MKWLVGILHTLESNLGHIFRRLGNKIQRQPYLPHLVKRNFFFKESKSERLIVS